MMDDSNSRRQLINTVMTLQHDTGADMSFFLWEKVATQVITLVGKNGFNSLYARSVLLAQDKFPGLGAASHMAEPDSLFAHLRKSMEGKTQAQINEANIFLMVIFTDIVASIIGEQLTMTILRSAWKHEIPDRSVRQ